MEKMGVLMILLGVWGVALVSEAQAEAEVLQDFCVADLDSEVQINGHPCKKNAFVTADDFVSTQLRTPNLVTSNLGTKANLVTAEKFPALNTQSLSFARIDFGPRGLNPPHVHPRGSEVLHVISGRLYSGFISSNNTLYVKTLLPGDLMVFPVGLLHFQLNLDDDSPAVALAAFNSQNPGRWDAARSLFNSNPNILDEIIKKTFFGLTSRDVSMLMKVVSKAYEDKLKLASEDTFQQVSKDTLQQAWVSA